MRARAAGAAVATALALTLTLPAAAVPAGRPAVTETQMTIDYLAASGDSERAAVEMAATHLVGRLGKPEDIGNVTMFLASPVSSFVNGVVWLVDGGQLAWRGRRG